MTSCLFCEGFDKEKVRGNELKYSHRGGGQGDVARG